MCCDKKRKQNEKEIPRNCCEDLCSLHMIFVTFETEGWCVQTPGAFLYKSLLASFCLQNTSNDFSIVPKIFIPISRVVLKL